VTREILYPQRRLSSASLGERGAASVRTWSFGAGVAPASFLRQPLIYPIFIGDASFNQLLKLRFRTRQDRNRLCRQIYAVLDRRSQQLLAQLGTTRIGRAIRLQYVEFAASGGALRVDAARDLLACFAFERDAAHRLVGSSLHAAQKRRNGFGELCGNDATGRIVCLSPVEGYAEAGATCAAGLAGVGGHAALLDLAGRNGWQVEQFVGGNKPVLSAVEERSALHRMGWRRKRFIRRTALIDALRCAPYAGYGVRIARVAISTAKSVGDQVTAALTRCVKHYVKAILTVPTYFQLPYQEPI